MTSLFIGNRRRAIEKNKNKNDKISVNWWCLETPIVCQWTGIKQKKAQAVTRSQVTAAVVSFKSQRFGCSWTKVYTGCRPQRVLRNGDPPVRSTSRLTSMASPQQYPPRRGSTFFVIIHYPDLTPPREWVIWNPSRQSQLSAPIISCVGLSNWYARVANLNLHGTFVGQIRLRLR